MSKVAVVGFGPIGRLAVRAGLSSGLFTPSAIVDIATPESMAPLFEVDMYVSRAMAAGLVPASDADLDFIAYARQDAPLLLMEVRRLRARVGQVGGD
jgi:hypothetical protein